ncbi:hypothetical protein RHGRI_035612 [Rhododendron griersonianum]|uniref:glutathione transferase n=1 Tax=Rhododendron griersonianum TaxID=479676 RepID=A0AAV6HMS5_9ERIC|nr:hypothetical protein RHGRI_035612 [Rhododendron griersonianum]
MKVHGEVFSSATQRVLACLYEKELDFEFVPVGMRTGAHKKQPFLSLNPFGLVPAFEDGDMTLFESRAINLYIAHTYEDKGTQLLYDGKKMAIASVWMDVEAHQFDPAASKLGGTVDAAAVQEKEAKLVQVLDIYEVRLAQFKYLGGDDFTLVDLHHLPRLQRLMGSQMKKLVDSRPHVRAWSADILARPAWLKVLAMQANN